MDWIFWIGAVLPIIYAIAAFILWAGIQRARRFKLLWCLLGFGLFFIYFYFITELIQAKTFGVVNDILILIGGLFLVAFSIVFYKTEEFREEEEEEIE
jgi:thiol:disulfide interchange protein